MCRETYSITLLWEVLTSDHIMDTFIYDMDHDGYLDVVASYGGLWWDEYPYIEVLDGGSGATKFLIDPTQYAVSYTHLTLPTTERV